MTQIAKKSKCQLTKCNTHCDKLLRMAECGAARLFAKPFVAGAVEAAVDPNTEYRTPNPTNCQINATAEYLTNGS